ncbi:hypothetical protein HYFRA_00000061 [Hymenoscyphus fraxineus]|uniref:Amidase domain-containing protein n=1 Tax=Hymenoscyphus fraxineus TaxID=746836 RepID=A0A9N9PVY6_9HELO|nr:hypothetical protein HYFRA_00000061 [Hymenoscyphus fraxineus]
MEEIRGKDGTAIAVKRIGLDGKHFIAVPTSKKYLNQKPDSPQYVTIIPLPDDCNSIKEDWLKSIVTKYEEEDDVFSKEFLRGIIFSGARNVEFAPEATHYLHTIGTTWLDMNDNETCDLSQCAGPHLIVNGQLFAIWRLYDDSQGAFVTPVVPATKGSTYSQLLLCGTNSQSLSVAVPSRLIAMSFAAKPLSGWRIAVKDIFQVKGIKTSVCNRAYYELYPEASQTAACIQMLEDMGAVLLGTTKLAAFAATEEPVECVDYQAPWNPRADGYQSPAGSSSGSGVAVASYEWVDIAIGSDTSGSGRRPGHWNGCFAHRPTHGVLPFEGYIPSFRQFDTPTFYARDVETCKEFASKWFGDKLPSKQTSPPSTIIYPTDYMSLITNQDQLRIINEFTTDLENSLGIKHQKLSFKDTWNADPPKEAHGESFEEYMKDACRNSFFYDDYHHFDKFREDYREKFSKDPYVSPPVRWQWNLSAGITRKERDVAVEKLAVYKRWFEEKMGQEAIVLIPIENITPRYRDEPLGRYFNPVGVPMLFVSPILGAPEFTVPIGQVPFKSKVTGNTEHLPVAISLLGSPGSDLELMDIARNCLKKAGRPTRVLPGAKLFA